MPKKKIKIIDEIADYNQRVLFPALDSRFDKIDKKFTNKFDKILTGQDELMKGIKNHREEDIIYKEQIDRRFENIEDDIGLEHLSLPTSAI